tara:strand:+ start:691 stop:1821 length:1131 start_codon:yes stop_codon:yes gene_type:complete
MKLLSYLSKWIKVYDFVALRKSDKSITFYSEGKNYWPYLKGILNYLAKNSNISIYYVTSDKDDPGLNSGEQNYSTLLIDDGYMRDWFFKKLNTYILITTMPDIDNFQIKKSPDTNYYIYTQHSLMSPNCSYRKGSFDNYDIIFCSGQYMIDEIRKAEQFYNLPKKELIQHGYTRLDSLISEYLTFKKMHSTTASQKKILLAPSWNKESIVELGLAEKIIQSSINQGFEITLRPHPESLKISYDKLQIILKRFSENSLFKYEESIVSNDSLFNSDLLITDWSGISLEYAFALDKPVLFINTPQKILNNDYKELGIQAFEAYVRDKIGIIWDYNESIDKTLEKYKNQNFNKDNHIFNIGKSDEVGALYIKDLVKEFIS